MIFYLFVAANQSNNMFSKLKTKKESFFLKNGAAILEQTITSFNGNCNPIRRYSIKELNKATNNFNPKGVVGTEIDLTIYKAVHKDGRKVLVKKFSKPPPGLLSLTDLQDIANEVAIASQMSKHKNVLKLLGCCLETELPTLVYEFPENGNLVDYWGEGERKREPLPWETKLRIATEIANSVAFLHHGFSKTIIHRDIRPSRVFLDKDNVAKLSEFRISIPIPEGKTHVDTDIIISNSFLAPETVRKGRFTERSDVYAFGALLCVLFTEKPLKELILGSDPCCRSSSNSEDEDESLGSLHPNSDEEEHYTWYGDQIALACTTHLKTNVLQQGNEMQVRECCDLVETCLSENIDERPNMIEVAKALRAIKNIKQ